MMVSGHIKRTERPSLSSDTEPPNDNNSNNTLTPDTHHNTHLRRGTDLPKRHIDRSFFGLKVRLRAATRFRSPGRRRGPQRHPPDARNHTSPHRRTPAHCTRQHLTLALSAAPKHTQTRLQTECEEKRVPESGWCPPDFNAVHIDRILVSECGKQRGAVPRRLPLIFSCGITLLFA